MSHKTWIAQPKKDRNTQDKPWEVKRENSERATEDFKTREKAWNRARELAEKHGTRPHPAEAKLKKRRDGQFSKIKTYPKQADRADRYM